jgi:hypothetical protein
MMHLPYSTQILKYCKKNIKKHKIFLKKLDQKKAPDKGGF